MVSDWTRRHVNFFRSIQITKSILFVILLMVIAVAAFNIVSTLVMVVKDKQSDIAILRTVGATPAELGLDHVVVTVTAAGRIFTADGEKTPEALIAWLNPHARRSRDETLPQLPSNVHLVIRADGAARWWEDVAGVLRAASDPENRMNRVVFAVRSADPVDTREGSFAFFLPLDSCLWREIDLEESVASVAVRRGSSLQSVLTVVDRLHRVGHRPWVVPSGERPELVIDGRRADLDAVTVPGTTPPRAKGLAGVTVLREMVEPVVVDPADGDGPFSIEERIGD